MKRLKLKPFVPFVPSEFIEQETIFQWAKVMESRHPELKLLHSTLNGVRLPIGLAVKCKRAGNKAGVPDIYLDVPRGPYHGLRIELKRRKNGQLSLEQHWWMHMLREEGYCVEVPKGANEAIEVIKHYLDIREG